MTLLAAFTTKIRNARYMSPGLCSLRFQCHKSILYSWSRVTSSGQFVERFLTDATGNLYKQSYMMSEYGGVFIIPKNLIVFHVKIHKKLFLSMFLLKAVILQGRNICSPFTVLAMLNTTIRKQAVKLIMATENSS